MNDHIRDFAILWMGLGICCGIALFWETVIAPWVFWRIGLLMGWQKEIEKLTKEIGEFTEYGSGAPWMKPKQMRIWILQCRMGIRPT